MLSYNFSCNTNRLTINSVFSLPCVCISRCNQLSFLLLYNQTHLTPGALLLQIQRVYNVVEANNENDKIKCFVRKKKGIMIIVECMSNCLVLGRGLKRHGKVVFGAMYADIIYSGNWEFHVLHLSLTNLFIVDNTIFQLLLSIAVSCFLTPLVPHFCLSPLLWIILFEFHFVEFD